MAMKITVIGGSGFVGTNLCYQLQSNQIDFEILDIKMSNQFPEKCKIADVRDFDCLNEAITGEIVVNLAAVHRDDVRDKATYYETNVEGAENVIKVCEEKGIKKIVFVSTVAVYGITSAEKSEACPISPFNEYGRTKFEAEEKFRAWHSSGERSLIIVRPTVIFGEGNRGNVYNLMQQVASRKFIMVGKGNNRKSMAYIGNVVSFLEACIFTDMDYAVFNYVDTPDLTMNDLVSHIRTTLGHNSHVVLRVPYWFGIIFGYAADALSIATNRRLQVSSVRVKKFTSSTVFSSAKYELSNFEQPFSLKEGLERTLASEFIAPDPRREIFHTE